MSFEAIKKEIGAFRSAEDLTASRGKAVVFNGSQRVQVASTAGTWADIAHGILTNNPDIDEAASVQISGVAHARLGGVVQSGRYLSVDANGDLVEDHPGGTVGVALDDGVAGSIIPVLLSDRGGSGGGGGVALLLDASNGPLTGELGAQNIVPSANDAYDLGSTANRWSEIFAFNVEGLGGNHRDVQLINPGVYWTDGPIGILSGFQTLSDPAGVSRITIDPYNYNLFPNAVFGTTTAYTANSDAQVVAYKMAGGILSGNAFASDGTALITGGGYGSLTSAYASTYGLGAQSNVSNLAAATALIGGCWQFEPNGISEMSIAPYSHGSIAAGIVYGNTGAGLSFVRVRDRGQFVQGMVEGYSSDTVTGSGLQGGSSNARGQFIQGAVEAAGSGFAVIEGGNNADGAFAQGVVDNAGANSGRIISQGQGSFAHGNILANGGGLTQIDASGDGSTAAGRATGGNDITASGLGSMAIGDSASGPISATASNAFQFGVGVNALADTLQVGNAGLRMKGTTGAPGAPQNGDMWVAGGYIYMRSNGVTRKFDGVDV